MRLQAVCGVSFAVHRGETLGIVGESGCGKSTLIRAILRLIEPTSGDVIFDGLNVTGASRPALRRLRRHVQIVFQDPFGSLNPRMRVGDIVAEPLVVQGSGSRRERAGRVAELLDRVGLGAGSASRFPHELSGGQRQRVGIARALACNPKLLVLDEPVSALDVSVQAQILNLLADLRDTLGLTYLFVAHDLSIVRYFCQRVAVMYLGEFVEVGPANEVFAHPGHPFTRALVSAIPGIGRVVAEPGEGPLRAEPSEPPSPISRPRGCTFHPRCPRASDRCRTEAPKLAVSGAPGESRLVACHHPHTLNG